MVRIDIRVHNLGMSGLPWYKSGTFDSPEKAAHFLEYWWQHLSCPEKWELEIDGLPYSVVPVSLGEEHIFYCCALHHAFYFPDEIPLDRVSSI
jgi:hypothetical protein